MAVRGRAAAVMAALDRRAPSVDEFAGQSWSSWVERTDLVTAGGSDLEDGIKTGEKMDAMTLIKEDMSIFGHCPAHDDFYLVVCNQCSQVVKPQAFQKHCERRHGAVSKLYSRAHTASSSRQDQLLNGETPTCRRHGGKPPRERAHGPRIRNHQPERQEKPPKENIRLFMPVVNLEKIPSLPKPDGYGFRLNPKSSTSPLPGPPLLSSQENPQNCTLAESPNKCLVSAKPSASAEPSVSATPSASLMSDALQRKPECSPASVDKGTSTTEIAQKCQKKLSRNECDLNRQCGVLSPDTRRVCTRLITCKIHSVHQRREVQGRAKDFDVLVAELKAIARNRERSPLWKESVSEHLFHDPSAASQPSTTPCRSKPSHVLHRISSDSDLEQDVPSPCEGESGLLHLFYSPSEESEEESLDELERLECPYVRRPPQPQAHCTFGSRLVGLGCYLFNRRLDHFCSAFSSMLERHLSSHMWRKIPPAADLRVPSVTPPAVPGCSFTNNFQNCNCSLVSGGPPGNPARIPLSSCTAAASIAMEARTYAAMSYVASSPHGVAACSQADCTGDSQAMTSPLPANTPSPSFSKLPSTKSSHSSRGKEGDSPDTEISPRKRKLSSIHFRSSSPHKRNCIIESEKTSSSPSKTKSSLENAVNGVSPSDTSFKRAKLAASWESSQQQQENRRASVSNFKAVQRNCMPEEEGKKRKTLATYYRPEKPKHLSAASIGFSARRKKAVPLLGFEEKQNALKSKAH